MQNNTSSQASLWNKIVSAFFTLIGICLSAAIIYICASFTNEMPILLSQPQTAQKNVVSMMDSLCAGEFSEASTYILGNPELGVGEQPKDAVGVLIWNAFLDSMSYELVGSCYATDAGLAQKIRFTCLDVTSITKHLKATSTQMLEERVQNAKDVSEIYNEDLEYREDVVMEVLQEAAASVIEERSQTMTVEIVVTLKYQNGQWWIVADTAFIDAVFGDILF